MRNTKAGGLLILAIWAGLSLPLSAQAKPVYMLSHEWTMTMDEGEEYLSEEVFYKYNKKGFLTYQARTTAEGGHLDEESGKYVIDYSTCTSRFKYDSKGRVLKKTEFLDGTEEERYQYKYLKNGNLSVEEFFLLGKLQSQKVYSYEKTKLSTITMYNGKGKVVAVESEKYNKRGDLASSVTKNRKGKILSTVRYRYRYKDDRILKKAVTTTDDMESRTEEAFWYYKNGNVRKYQLLAKEDDCRTDIKKYFTDGSLKYTYYMDDEGNVWESEYDHGRILKETFRGDEAEYVSITTYKYKMKGKRPVKRWKYRAAQWEEEGKEEEELLSVTEYEYTTYK